MSDTEKEPGWWSRLKAWQQLVVVSVGGLVALAAIAVVMEVLWSVNPGGGPSERGARDVCEQFVERRLKAPATAEFSESTVMQGGGEWVVEGDVDSENGFGALIRSEYSCTVRPYDEEATDWELVDLQLAE